VTTEPDQGPVTPDLPPGEELSDVSLDPTPDVPADVAAPEERAAEDVDPEGAGPEPPD
jgi:hypothetical protein